MTRQDDISVQDILVRARVVELRRLADETAKNFESVISDLLLVPDEGDGKGIPCQHAAANGRASRE
jgi:hypothetical protein